MRTAKACLIDGTAFCYRAFYAIRGLSTLDGRPTNAVYGFARMLHALREREQPDYLAVAFDVGKPTFRHRQFEDYKSQRKPMPDPLIAQLPLVKSLLAAYRIPVFEQEGYEAEDVLATIAKRIAREGVEVLLVTGDKDALQLVNSHVKVYNPHKDDGVLLDAGAVHARYGVGPDQMVDLMALMGDDIDNIPGVPGIGEKTARELLQRFGSLDSLYQRLNEVEPPARRASLEAAREQVKLSRDLARIQTELPMPVTLEELKPQEPDWRALRSLFRDLEFKQLLAAVDVSAPPPDPRSITVHPVRTSNDLERCVQTLQGAATTAIWCSAAGEPSAGEARSEGVVLALAAGDPSTPRQRTVAGRSGCRPPRVEGRRSGAPDLPVPRLSSGRAQSEVEGPGELHDTAWVGRLDRAMLKTAAGSAFARWLAGSARKIGHDAKAAKRGLGALGLELNGIAGDTMLAAYLLNPARTNQTLTDLSAEYLDQPLAVPPTGEGPLAELSQADLRAFGGQACAIARLHALLAPKLQAAELMALYTELELPLLQVLATMERTGVALDLPYLAGLQRSMQAELARLTEEVYRLAGHAFNLNSPKQLAQVLFAELQLPVVKRTKTGPSTDSSVLQQLAERHPLPRQLIQYRELAKLVSTYVEALPKLVNPTTGRLHTSFNQAATATGRLSSSEPNLQNIPIKTELGRSIRRAFVPGLEDGVLLAADYSQIELRILAHLAGDERLAEAFRRGHDIHRFTASLIYGLPEPEVQPEQRNAMKAVNYGILYGMTAHGLSNELGIPIEEAQAFITAYFERYPKVRGYLDAQIARARRDGFVQTLLGRRRYIPEVNAADQGIRQFGERMAVNAPIQGSAADLIKRAMIQLEAALERDRLASRMVLQVHDELVFETPRKELAALVPIVRRIMEGAIALDVPLEVTMKAGPNWLDLTPII